MSDRLVEGEQTLAFVHPLVRSAVYRDMAPPIRQGLHLGAARMLAAEGCPSQDVAVHLLECGHATDPWAVSMLRRAAGQAREQGAPDLALRCLERALAQTRDPEVRNEVLAELGSMEVGEAPDRAVEHLTGALSSVTGPARRAAVALPLGQALAVCGRFAESVEVLARAVAELGDDNSGLRARLQAVLLDTARWDMASTARADALLAELDQQEEAGGELAPALQAILATYQTSVLCDRPRALSHARRVLPAATRLFDLSAPIVPETISVLLFCDQLDEARQAVQDWLRLTQSRGLPIASSVAASFASFVALHAGAVSESAAWARQALDASGSLWVSPIAVAVLVLALIERGDSAAAHQELAAYGLVGDLGRTWPANRVRYARACLHAADGDHRRAADDLLAAGDLAERWRMRNPALMNWRSAAALSLAALGRPPTPASYVPKNSGWPGAGARAGHWASRCGQRESPPAASAGSNCCPRRPTCWAGARPGWSTPEPWPISAPRCAAPGPGPRPGSRCARPWTSRTPTVAWPWPSGPAANSSSPAAGRGGRRYEDVTR